MLRTVLPLDCALMCSFVCKQMKIKIAHHQMNVFDCSRLYMRIAPSSRLAGRTRDLLGHKPSSACQ